MASGKDQRSRPAARLERVFSGQRAEFEIVLDRDTALASFFAQNPIRRIHIRPQQAEVSPLAPRPRRRLPRRRHRSPFADDVLLAQPAIELQR